MKEEEADIRNTGRNKLKSNKMESQKNNYTAPQSKR
jgi:hypothetical protein